MALCGVNSIQLAPQNEHEIRKYFFWLYLFQFLKLDYQFRLLYFGLFPSFPLGR